MAIHIRPALPFYCPVGSLISTSRDFIKRIYLYERSYLYVTRYAKLTQISTPAVFCFGFNLLLASCFVAIAKDASSALLVAPLPNYRHDALRQRVGGKGLSACC